MKNPRQGTAAAIPQPISVAQRDVGAVREPPLRGPIVIPAHERESRRGVCGSGGGSGSFTAFTMTETCDHSCVRRNPRTPHRLGNTPPVILRATQ